MAGASVKLSVRLLGPIEVLVDGNVVEIPGRRPRALLAVLALSAGELVPAGSLYERVWGHDQPGDVRANLYTCVRRLRKALGDTAIVNESGRYSLRVEPDSVDAVRFIRLVDRTRAVGADPEPLLRAALELWQGAPFGAEPLSDWLDGEESRRLTERWLAAVQERIDLDFAAGRGDDLVEELEQLTAAYPLREPLWVRYLTVLDRAGRPADALAAYERIRVRLADELGIDPSPELQGVHAALLHGEPTTGATGVEALIPRQLPADTAGFIGRDEALAELDRLIDGGGSAGAVVISAVHGLAGIGKTTLAVHWAHRVADRFPDGQLFVNLQGYGPGEPMEPTAALDVLLHGLGVPGERIPADLDARSALLRSNLAGKRLLLVVDNARDPGQVRPLLPGAQGAMVLITSRSQLRGLAARDGARGIALDALPELEAIALLRARLTTGPTHDVLAELAGLCGYLPLALTIAAERANQDQDGLSALIADLRDEQARLDTLADQDDPLADIRAVLAWSCRVLDVDAARLLRLLGLAPGSDISAEAAAALAGIPASTARRLLDRLVAASLAAVQDGRYALHDLLRLYAAEQAREFLGEQEREQATNRLYHWCLRTTTSAALAIKPTMSVIHPDEDVVGIQAIDFDGDEADAAAWLEREDAFLDSVVHAAAGTHPWVVYGIARGVWNQSRWTRSWSDAVELQEFAVHAARSLNDEAAEARALITLGVVHLTAADYLMALKTCEQALPLAERVDDAYAQAMVLDTIGLINLQIGRFTEAVHHHQRSIELHLRLGQEGAAAKTRNNLAYDLTALSLHDQAVDEARRAVATFGRLGPNMSHREALDTLGRALHGRGDYGAAIDCFREALDLGIEEVVPFVDALIMASLARSLYAAGRRSEARMTLQSAIALIDEHSISDGYELRRGDLVEMLADVTQEARAR